MLCTFFKREKINENMILHVLLFIRMQVEILFSLLLLSPTIFKEKDRVQYMEEIQIDSPFITLSQLLKFTNIFESGGFIKMYIQNEGVYVNDDLEFRRGKKLYDGDIIRLISGETFIVKSTTVQ